jgi:membrane-anchored protein YejM (alkaline phosphatase superfamily)
MFDRNNINVSENVTSNSWGVDEFALRRPILDWIEQDVTKPFFIVYWSSSTHHPYFIPDEKYSLFRNKTDRDKYYNSLHYTDDFISEVISDLYQRNLSNNTLIVVTADHGINFNKNGDFVFYDLDEGAIHMPLILINPSFKNNESNVLGSHVDVVPTLLDFLGIYISNPFQGRSLFDIGLHENRTIYFSETWKFIFGLRNGPLKYAYFMRDNRSEFYDLSKTDVIYDVPYHERPGFDVPYEYMNLTEELRDNVLRFVNNQVIIYQRNRIWHET